MRTLWSDPDTRKQLLDGLAETGFGRDQLSEIQKIIDAEKSDLFDVLAYVAYAMPPLTREERATRANVAISQQFNTRQQAFLAFVLVHYVSVGVEKLDRDKLTPLLSLKYHNSIAVAIAELGRPEEIGQVFVSSGTCTRRRRRRDAIGWKVTMTLETAARVPADAPVTLSTLSLRTPDS